MSPFVFRGSAKVPRCGRGRPRSRLRRVNADRGYDSGPVRQRLKKRGTELIAPYRSNNRHRRFEDRRKLRRYRERWKIERTNACAELPPHPGPLRPLDCRLSRLLPLRLRPHHLEAFYATSSRTISGSMGLLRVILVVHIALRSCLQFGHATLRLGVRTVGQCDRAARRTAVLDRKE